MMDRVFSNGRRRGSDFAHLSVVGGGEHAMIDETGVHRIKRGVQVCIEPLLGYGRLIRASWRLPYSHIWNGDDGNGGEG
jgi:hypothetical protein